MFPCVGRSSRLVVRCVAETCTMLSTFEAGGFAVISRVVSRRGVKALRAEADGVLRRSGCRGGARNLLHRSDCFRSAAELPELSTLASEALGLQAWPTKLTLFDKSKAANWLIRWHQDLTITVRERRPVAGFEAWSLKEGVIHVRPPVKVLENVVAIRLHLDDTPATNGALRVIPGTHQLGRLTREEIATERQKRPEVTCEVGSGGAMLMSPLLLHASSKSAFLARRRVLHIEYSGQDLPGGLEWA